MASHAMFRTMTTAGVCQLCGLQQRTYVFFRSAGHNFVTQIVADFKIVRSKSSALNTRKNVFESNLQLQNIRRLSSGQTSAQTKHRMSLSTRLLLVTSGAASIGYYIAHTTRRSELPVKQWERSVNGESLRRIHTKVSSVVSLQNSHKRTRRYS